MEDVNKRRRDVLSLSKLESSPQEIISMEICYIRRLFIQLKVMFLLPSSKLKLPIACLKGAVIQGTP